MTGITALRPPRSSVSSAYLSHLNRKKQQPPSVPAVAPPPTTPSSEAGRAETFPGQLAKATSAPLAATASTRPPSLVYAESTADNTAVTSTSGSSGSGGEHSGSGGSSQETNGSVRERSDDTGAWDLERHLSTALVLVDDQEPRAAQGQDTQQQQHELHLSGLLDQLMMVQGDLGSFELGSFGTNTPTSQEYDEEEEEDDDEDCVGDDDDSLSALNRLLDETSRRWEQNTLLTHREFCRLPNCRICLSQSEGIIAQQQAEIKALRAKLNQQHHQVEFSGLYPPDAVAAQPPQAYDHHDEADANYLPIEQIEVYHGDDDCNVSVTSGLTNLYPDHHSINLTPDGAADNHALHRPDADSASVNMTHPPLAQGSTTTRVRGHAVSLTAADGSVRQAVYSGPMLRGKPHGVGVLKFVESGDIYLGDLQNGCMHGHGTYTFKDSKKNRNRKAQVLKGTFQNNVFTGYASPDLMAPPAPTDSW